MPTIVLISPKGGVGKTTSALALGTQLAKNGIAVTMIDADPNRPLRDWSEKQLPDNMAVVSDVDEENVLDVIEDAAARTPFVVVDLEGTAAKIALLAVSQADLVLIPMQPSPLDAKQANRALRVIAQQQKLSGKKVPYAILFTRTSATITTRGFKEIRRNLDDAGVPILPVSLMEREAYKAMFAFNLPLESLDPKDVPNIAGTIENAEAFTTHVLSTLRVKEKRHGA